jgi:hypothetical protein
VEKRDDMSGWEGNMTIIEEYDMKQEWDTHGRQ